MHRRFHDLYRRSYHGLSCRFSTGRRPRHAAVLTQSTNKRFKSRSAGTLSQLEPTDISRFRREETRVTLIPAWSHDKCFCWDVTAGAHNGRASCIADSIVQPGAASDMAERETDQKYANPTSTSNTWPLKPLALGVQRPRNS